LTRDHSDWRAGHKTSIRWGFRLLFLFVRSKVIDLNGRNVVEGGSQSPKGIVKIRK